MDILSTLIVLLPSIVGYKVGDFCNVKDSSGESVKFRPEPKVFGIVWAILYLFIGLSFLYALSVPNTQILVITLYVCLNIALCSWIYLYSCKNEKIVSIYAMIISIVFALMCYTVGNTYSKLLITPLIGWLILATMINVEEVNQMNIQKVKV